MNNYMKYNNANLILGGKSIPNLTIYNNNFNTYPFINCIGNNSLNKNFFPINYQGNLYNNYYFIFNSLLKEHNFYQNIINSIMSNNSDFKINNMNVNYKIIKNIKNRKEKLILNNIEESGDKEKNIQKISKLNLNQKNIINISLILSGKEKRTFVRVFPIPKKYSVYDITRIIDKYLKTMPGKRIYNAIYLPLSKKIGINIGYFFINLVSPKYVIQFYEIFNGFYFRFKNFKKPCFVVFSDNQEIDTSKEDPRRRPIIFYDTIKDEKNEVFEDEK